MKTKDKDVIPLGTKAEWGEISMVGSLGGERYYWMTARNGAISMLPATVVEDSLYECTFSDKNIPTKRIQKSQFRLAKHRQKPN